MEKLYQRLISVTKQPVNQFIKLLIVTILFTACTKNDIEEISLETARSMATKSTIENNTENELILQDSSATTISAQPRANDRYYCSHCNKYGFSMTCSTCGGSCILEMEAEIIASINVVKRALGTITAYMENAMRDHSCEKTCDGKQILPVARYYSNFLVRKFNGRLISQLYSGTFQTFNPNSIEDSEAIAIYNDIGKDLIFEIINSSPQIMYHEAEMATTF